MLPEYTPGANLYDYAFYGNMQTDDNVNRFRYQVGGTPWSQQQQQGGGNEQIIEYIKMYSEITQQDPNDIYEKVSSMSQEDQQAALQEIIGTIQEYYTMQQSRQQDQMVDEQGQSIYSDEEEDEYASPQKPIVSPTPNEIAGLEEEAEYNAAVEAATADYDEEYMYGGSKKRGRNKFTSQLKKAARGMAQEMVNTDSVPTGTSSYGGERLKKFVSGIQRNVANNMAEEAFNQSMDYFEQPEMMRYGGLPRYQGAQGGSETTGNTNTQTPQNITLTPEQFNQLLSRQYSNQGYNPGNYGGYGGYGGRGLGSLLHMFGAAPISNDWYMPRGYRMTNRSQKDLQNELMMSGRIPLEASYLSNVEATKGFLGNINNPRKVSMTFSRALPQINAPGSSTSTSVTPAAAQASGSNTSAQNNTPAAIGVPPLLDPNNVSTTQPVSFDRNYLGKPLAQTTGVQLPAPQPNVGITGLSAQGLNPSIPTGPSYTGAYGQEADNSFVPNNAAIEYMKQSLTLPERFDLSDVGPINLNTDEEIKELNRQELIEAQQKTSGRAGFKSNPQNIDPYDVRSSVPTGPYGRSGNINLAPIQTSNRFDRDYEKEYFAPLGVTSDEGIAGTKLNKVSPTSMFTQNTGLPRVSRNSAIPFEQKGGQLYLYRNGGLPRFQGPDASQVTLAPASISNPGQSAKTFGDSEFAMEPFDNSALVAARPQPMQLPTKTLQEVTAEAGANPSMKTLKADFVKNPLSASQWADIAYSGTNLVTNLKNRADQELAQAQILERETDPLNYTPSTFANFDEGININTYDPARNYTSFMGQRQQFSPGITSGFGKFGGVLKYGGTYEMDLSPEEIAYIQQMGGTIEYI
jgi:hypothetical protein